MSIPPNDIALEHRQREATSLKILGFFLAVLGVLVLVGTFWSLDNPRAVIVNVASGAVLVLVGLGMFAIARRIDRQISDHTAWDEAKPS